MNLRKLLVLGLLSVVLLSSPMISETIEVKAETVYLVDKTQIGSSDCYWAITSDGTLEITGTGDPQLVIADVSEVETKIPWYDRGSEIKEVTFQATVEPEIINYWFKDCNNLTEVSNIPSTVYSANYTFQNCTSLDTLHFLPDSLYKANGMFYGCTSLIDAPSFPSIMTECVEMFYGCTSLETAPYLPYNVRYTKKMFYGCTSLKQPSNITYDVANCESMFEGCILLESIPEIPDSVTICENMFAGCISLTEVPQLSDSIANCKNMFKGCVNIQKVTNIPYDTKDCTGMFEGCTSLTEIPEITPRAMYCNSMLKDCTSLEKVPEIPGEVLECASMFEGCTGITEVPTIPNTVTNTSNMFKFCENITETGVLPDSITNCASMFWGCTNLEKAYNIPNNVEDCTGMFGYCENLQESPEIPDNVIDISSLYTNCINLKDAPKLPSGLKKANFTFSNCESLVKAPVLPDTLEECIYLFSECSNLKEVPKITANLKSSTYMFFECTSLEEVYIGDNANTDYMDMFNGCTNLKTVILRGSSPYMNHFTFENAGTSDNKVTLYYGGNCSEEFARELAATGENVIIKPYELIIKSHPEDVKVTPNTEVTFEVKVLGAEETYQWYMASDKITDGNKIPDANSSTYTIKDSDVTSHLNNKYFYCVITDMDGTSLKSERAELNVLTVPTAPVFSATVNSSSWSNKAVEIKLIGSDFLGDTEGVCYKYSLDGGITWKDYDTSFVWSTDTSGSTIKAKAYHVDYPTQFSEESSFIIKYDATAPIIDACTVSNNTIAIEAYDSTSGINGFALTKTKAIPEEWKTESVFEVQECGVYYAWAVDKAGNTTCYPDAIEVLSGAETCQHLTRDILNRKEATCKEKGYTGDICCIECGELISEGNVIERLSTHTWGTDNKCVVCGQTKTNNQVTEPNSQNPNSGTPTNPNEVETDNQKLNEEISKAKKNKAKISKITNKKGKKIQIKVKKQKGYKYEIQISTSKKFKKSVKKYTTSKTTYTTKKLKQSKKYYIRVRTYKVIDGTKVYGKWSSVKSVKISK